MYVCHGKRSDTEPNVPTPAYSRLRHTGLSTPKMGQRKGVKTVDTNNLGSATVYMCARRHRYRDVEVQSVQNPSSNTISDMGIKCIFVCVC
jgi:hypothetical protein